MGLDSCDGYFGVGDGGGKRWERGRGSELAGTK